MDKEKQIEDLTNIIDSFHIRTYSNAKAVAKFLVEKYNYRKINEDEVVISKKEKQKLLKEMYKQGRFDAIADLEKDYKVVLSKEKLESFYTEEEVSKISEYKSKETARECWRLFKQQYLKGYDWVKNEIAKRFGVDLGEDK